MTETHWSDDENTEKTKEKRKKYLISLTNGCIWEPNGFQSGPDSLLPDDDDDNFHLFTAVSQRGRAANSVSSSMISQGVASDVLVRWGCCRVRK